MKQVSTVDMHFGDTQFKQKPSYCPMLADSSRFLCRYLETDNDNSLQILSFIIILPVYDAVLPQHQKHCQK